MKEVSGESGGTALGELSRVSDQSNGREYSALHGGKGWKVYFRGCSWFEKRRGKTLKGGGRDQLEEIAITNRGE